VGGTGTTVPVGTNAPPAGGAAPAPGAGSGGGAGAGPSSASGTGATTQYKLASQHLGADVADTRLAGVGILAAIFGVAGIGLASRGFARRQGFGRRW
jgi:hypothetical protein